MAEQGKLEGFRAAAARVGMTGAVRRAPLNTPIPKMKDKYDCMMLEFVNTFHTLL